jgi:uncharacterized membrane protein YkoI
MRALILSAALLALSGTMAVEAQGLRNTLARCARAAGPAGMSEIERIEMLTTVSPAELAGAPRGTPFLTFELRHPDGTTWEVICNGETGAVIDVEREVPSAMDPLFARQARISERDARKTALQFHPGEILGVEYEVASDGTPTYEFAVKPASGTAGLLVEINATSGQLKQVWAHAYPLQSE